MLQRVVLRFCEFAGLDKCLHSNLNSYLHIARVLCLSYLIVVFLLVHS